MLVEVIIPFRDRGKDPLRQLNLVRVLEHWETEHGLSPYVCTDGRRDDEQFNRSAAYNRGIQHAHPDTDVYVFAESDMLIRPEQIEDAVKEADQMSGLVVPFTEYRYMGAAASERIRAGRDPEDFIAEWMMKDGRSIGAINVVSRRTMDMIGRWDENFEGSWYDDDAMRIAFELCTSNDTRFIEGQAHHLYHLPGWKGEHRSAADKAAVKANRLRLQAFKYARDTSNVALVRRLLRGDM